MRRVNAWASVLAVAVLGGCAGTQEFVPTERANTQTTTGYTAAQYDLWGPEGNIGEATVWSSGAYRTEDETATVIEVRFRIESTAQEPMLLDAIVLESVTLDGERSERIQPARVEGSRVVQPGEDNEVLAYFVVSPQYDPDDIYSFRVGWELRFDGDAVYTQHTPFMQAPEPYAYYTPYYDPFFHPGWGYGPAWRGWGMWPIGGVSVVPEPRALRTRWELTPPRSQPAAHRSHPARSETSTPVRA